MQSMQRQFGKLLHKSPGDNAKVAVLLNDYEDADKVLVKVRIKKEKEKPIIVPCHWYIGHIGLCLGLSLS